jgi:hypothetical protein
MKTDHDGDCSIYASLSNYGMPEAGICTCGYGHQKNRQDGLMGDMYSKDLINKLESVIELWYEAWSLAGKSLFYMQFLNPGTDWGEQKKRIEQMCYHLAQEGKSHFENTQENREWFWAWMRKFNNEVENQC